MFGAKFCKNVQKSHHLLKVYMAPGSTPVFSQFYKFKLFCFNILASFMNGCAISTPSPLCSCRILIKCQLGLHTGINSQFCPHLVFFYQKLAFLFHNIRKLEDFLFAWSTLIHGPMWKNHWNFENIFVPKMILVIPLFFKRVRFIMFNFKYA